MEDLQSKGVALDESSIQNNPDGSLVSVYLADEIDGFAVHLIQWR